MSAALQTPGGVLDFDPPTRLASAAKGQQACDVNFGGGRAGRGRAKPKLKRWFRWDIEAKTEVDNLNNPADVSWAWSTNPASGFVFTPPATPVDSLTKTAPHCPHNTTSSPNCVAGTRTFSAWLSAPTLYSADVKATVSVQKDKVAKKSLTLSVGKPSVILQTFNSTTTLARKTRRGPAAPVYTTTLMAKSGGFCGDESKLSYAWKKNGQPLALAGPGPIPVSLGSGEQEIYEVVVSDKWDVEFVVEAIVIRAPVLVASIKLDCPEAAKEHAVIPDVENPGKMLFTPTLCTRPELVVTAGDGGAVGADFPPAPRGRLKFEWKDLRYWSATTQIGDFQDMPAAWWGGSSGGRSLLPTDSRLALTLPKNAGLVHLQAAVNVTDAYARAASAAFVATNDVTPLSDIAAAVASTAKKYSKGGAPTGRGGRGGGGVTDPLDKALQSLVWQARYTDPSPESVAALRSQLEATANFGIDRELRATGRAVPTRAVPRFTSLLPAPESGKSLRARARADARKRVGSDPSMQQRFPGEDPKREDPKP
jgi:hypothetical protein